jgi:hypothetical protein
MKLKLTSALNPTTPVYESVKEKETDIILEHCLFLNSMNEDSYSAKAMMTRVLAFNGFNPSTDINSLHKKSADVVNKYKAQMDAYTKLGINKLSAIKEEVKRILNGKADLLHDFDDLLAFKVNGYSYTLENDVPRVQIYERLNTQFATLTSTNISAEKILEEYINTVKTENYKNAVRAEILGIGSGVSNRDYTTMLFKSFRNNSDKVELMVNKSELEYSLDRLSNINETMTELVNLKNEITKQITLIQKSIEECYKMDNNTGRIRVPEIGLDISVYNRESLYTDNVKAIKTLLDVKYNELEFIAQVYTTALAYRISALIEEHLHLVSICNEAYYTMIQTNKGGE